MKYVAALILILNCASLSAADLSAENTQEPVSTSYTSSMEYDDRQASQMIARSGQSAPFGFDSAYAVGGSPSAFSTGETDGASSVSIPAALWLFGSIILGVSVILYRKLSSGNRL